MLRGDYAGSDRCRFCHTDIFRAWAGSPMHQMTRMPEGAQVRAPFDGRTWRYKEDSATFLVREGGRFVHVRSPAFGTHLYRVTKVIGGRYREDYAGLDVNPHDLALAPGVKPNEELILPVSYVFSTETFRLKGHSVMVRERPGLRAGGVWNQTCVFCHNTVPQFATVWGALHGPGAPGYQGQTVDRLLPLAQQMRWKISDESALKGALADEMKVMQAPVASDDLRPMLAKAMRETRQRVTADHFIEVGIGCESCHGGSLAHVADSSVLPSYRPKAPFMQLAPAGQARTVGRAEWINRSCARCHQVLFSRYPYTWEGELRRSAHAGGSHTNSGEARDFLLGACAREMACTTCHNPHAEDDALALQRLGTVAGNGTCTSCHSKYAAPAALAAHSHHSPESAGAACVACHMPRKNMGLSYDLVRYHRIGSPTDEARVLGDRPLECALCHAGESTESLVKTMETWWGQSYDRKALSALYGADLSKNNLRVSLRRGRPHEQVVAARVLAEAGDMAALPDVAKQLLAPMPLVRHFGLVSLERMLPGACKVEIDRSTTQIAAALDACLPGGLGGGAVEDVRDEGAADGGDDEEGEGTLKP